MEKQNIKIDRCEGLEVYCTRPFFGYNCNNTPNNCTECPLMRFMYKDLTDNVLTDEPAAELKNLVEDSQAFSGKFDGHTDAQGPLPQEVWTAIYAIRSAYYQCIIHTENITSEEKEECYQRFVRWFGEHGKIDGMPAGRFCVRKALNEIYAGKWLVMDPNDKRHEWWRYPAVEEHSGTYVPVAFDDAADGIRYIIDYLFDTACKIHPAFNKKNCTVAIVQTDKDSVYQRMQLYLTPAGDMVTKHCVWLPDDGRGIEYPGKRYTGWYPSKEEFSELMSKMHKVSGVLEKVHEHTASTYRARYLRKVKEKQPNIEFVVAEDDYPQDPNHPIHKESSIEDDDEEY